MKPSWYLGDRTNPVSAIALRKSRSGSRERFWQMNGMEVEVLTVPLGREIHGLAMPFAAEQGSSKKGKQVYLNTLAVYAVHRYLKWLQVETDLSQGNCWDSGKRSLFDVADLVIPNVGKLECRPLLPKETVC